MHKLETRFNTKLNDVNSRLDKLITLMMTQNSGEKCYQSKRLQETEEMHKK